MFSKDEVKALSQEFWSQFNAYSGTKRRRKGLSSRWMLQNTGVKGLNLKFHIDRKVAVVGIDVETKDEDLRIILFDKLEKLKTIIEKSVGHEMTWELDYENESGKDISRVYDTLDGVDLYRKDCWREVNTFFFKNMFGLEKVIEEYRDYLAG